MLAVVMHEHSKVTVLLTWLLEGILSIQLRRMLKVAIYELPRILGAFSRHERQQGACFDTTSVSSPAQCPSAFL